MQNLEIDGDYFYEWTNTVFIRLISGNKFYKKNNAMQLSDSGYDALRPLGSMLSSALGVSEVEFAKFKDKGKAYEKQFLQDIFSRTDKSDGTEQPQELNLKRVKEIFSKYNLRTDISLSKKRANQNLLNDMYSECLEIMKKRLDIQLERGNIEDIDTYIKQQKFYLRKMNFNYANASKKSGFRFSKTPIIHDIGKCDDNLPKKDFFKIANEQVAMADFGFDNKNLKKYSTTMTPTKNSLSFRDRLQKNLNLNQTRESLKPKEKNKTNNLEREGSK